MLKLTFELVPETSHFKNVRSSISQDKWKIIARECYKRANYKCEICGGRGDKHPVECHEVWDYNIDTKCQLLTGLIALCPACHEVKHIGLATIRNRKQEAINHFCFINDVSEKQAYSILNEAWKLYKLRSMYQWSLNIDVINSYL